MAVALAVIGWHACDVRADDAALPAYTFSGFGTLGVVHSNNDQADLVYSVVAPTGAGRSHPWSGDVDSRLAVQGNATFTPQISAVVQVVSEQRYDNSYTPTVEWANIQYQPTPDLTLRLGRVVLPAFLVSDYRKVGYANPWVRPPLEVYDLVPISSGDGLDASYRMHLAAVTNTVQADWDRSATKLPGGGTGLAVGAWGVTDTAEFGPATLRATYHRADLTVDSFAPLFDAFRQFGPQGQALADKYDVQGKRIVYVGLGGNVDPGDWFVTAEWGHTSTDSVLGRKSAWYASAGYRVGKFTPYAIYARAKVESATSDPGLSLTGLPASLAGAVAGLNAALNALLAGATDQSTHSVGARWDVSKNAALKLQFDDMRVTAGSTGIFVNALPGFRSGAKVDVVSATVDFVF